MPSSHVALSEHERSTLESWTRSSTISAGHAERARIVLAIADGVGTSATASLVGVSRPTVIKWRDRCAVRGLAGLDDEPPQNAIGRCVDEKSQIQALNRTQPILPVRPGLPAKATHDYKRNGTTTLFAALEVATGTVTDRCYDRHGKAEFLDFLKHVAKAYPRQRLHVVLDNYHTHKHDDINQWLAKHPRITLHFTPTSGSWLNLVEVFFGIITRQAIRRGSFENVKQLVSAIRAFIDGYNQRCEPFRWTKTADQILAKADRQKNSDTRH